MAEIENKFNHVVERQQNERSVVKLLRWLAGALTSFSALIGRAVRETPGGIYRLYFLYALLEQVFMTWVCITVINYFTGWEYFSFYAGLFLWITLLCFTPLSKVWFFYVTANSILVLEDPNPLLSDPEPIIENVDPSKMEKTRILRAVVGPKIGAKHPWEQTVTVIHTERSISLGDEMVNAFTRNDVPVEIRFKAFITPIATEQCALNLARHSMPYVKEFFQGMFKAFIIATVASMTDIELQTATYDNPDDPTQKITGAEHLQKRFANIFGGKGKVDITEMNFGVYTGSPIITDILVNPKNMKARQAVAASAKFAEAAEILVSRGKLKPSVAANIVAQFADLTVPVTITEYLGLEGTRGHIILGNPNIKN